MRGVSRARLTLGILGIVVLVASAVGVSLAVTGRSSAAAGAPSAATYPRASGVAVGTVTAGRPAGTGIVNAGSGSPALSYPTWCCSGGNPLGLTATGQATVSGAGAAARVLAIGRAVADAVSQARAAAAGAGISLGKIINVQVSVPSYSYPYPLPMGASSRAGSAGGAPVTSACPVGLRCPYPAVSVAATVTVTWAIG